MLSCRCTVFRLSAAHLIWTSPPLTNPPSFYVSSLLLTTAPFPPSQTLTFPIIFDPFSPSLCATWKFWEKKNLQTLLRFQFAGLFLHWNPRIINCFYLDNSGSLYCKFMQPSFDCTYANALQTAEAFKLQSQTVRRGKSASPLTLCSTQPFMILHAISLNCLNLKVSILQSSCRAHNWFIQSLC